MARTAKILEGRNRANDSEAASFVERFEELEANVLKRRMSFLEDCRKIRHEQKELLDDAKSQGVAKQVVRSVVRARALQTNITALEENLEDDDRQLFKGIRDVLGDYGDTPLGQAAIDSEEGQQDATTAARCGRCQRFDDPARMGCCRPGAGGCLRISACLFCRPTHIITGTLRKPSSSMPGTFASASAPIGSGSSPPSLWTSARLPSWWSSPGR